MSTTDGPGDCLSGDSNVGTKDIWFVHDAACTGTMTVSLCANTNYDNTVQIYETAACDPLGGQLDCGDDTCGQAGGPATLTVPVVQGTQYLIRTGGWGGSFGSGEINLSISPADVGDDDGDGVANSCDLCPGFDDNIDCQPNGIPDGCETDTDGDMVPDDCDPCPLDNPDDTDGDGVCDTDDICPGGDDNVDVNGNGIPDACEIESPTPALPPHDIRKIRYISIDPRGSGGVNVGKDLDIRLTLVSTLVNGVPAVGTQWWANDPDVNCISVVGPTRPILPPNWDACPTLHLTGCPIIPTSIYDIVVMDGGAASDSPLVAETQLKPADEKWWGDAVGFFTGPKGNPPNVWTGPQGVTNFDDVNACLRTFIDPNAVNATHTTISDVHPNRPDLGGLSVHPNKLVSIDDTFQFIQAFQGAEYPGGDLAGCTDP
ncbi:MAG: hypothetical protein IIB57_12285 [Planctomycetes bacterium]|nr:hypothetical protein [Planctomycetota bacterium]